MTTSFEEYTNMGKIPETRVEYRGYVFVNRALSSIQKGVQGAHALVELTSKPEYQQVNVPGSLPSARALDTWRILDKTLVFLDCGFHQEILEHYLTAASFCEKFKLPHALFVEDDWTMNSMATAFAIIVPDTIYDIDIDEYYMSQKHYTTGITSGYTFPHAPPPDIEFHLFLKGFKLAI